MVLPAMDTASTMLPPRRKLDFLIACYNRPRYLHRILQSGLALDIDGVCFVVFDDASDLSESVPGLGVATTEEVCRSFNDSRVIYVRNPVNVGFAKSLERYYGEFCDAQYVALSNPKDEFISADPIVSAIAKLDADPKISLIVFPIRHADRYETDKEISFSYTRMSGRDFIHCYVRDLALQHCGSYAIVRATSARRVGVPRNLDLRALGLEDGSGIDHDVIFNVATTGDVDFETKAPIRRHIIGGYTELFPLTFAYTQYQYAKRLMAEFEPRGIVSRETRRRYLSFWHLIMARGLVVAYRPIYGTETERGVMRIRPHLRMPLLLYMPLEWLRSGTWPSDELKETYREGAKLLLADWWEKICGRPHIA